MFPAAKNQRRPKGRGKGASHKGHTHVQDRDKWLPGAWVGMEGAAPGQGGGSLLEPEWWWLHSSESLLTTTVDAKGTQFTVCESYLN